MNSRVAFVGIGLAVNLLILVRGVVFMAVLDYRDLGLVALVQSVIAFGGMLHFGLLNGGYRLLCSAGERQRQRIVELAYTAFVGLGAAAMLVAGAFAASVEDALFQWLAGMTALGAIATLIRQWQLNEMVATTRLAAANTINGIAIAASLALLFALPYAPALVAVGSVVIQPAVFVVLALVSGAVRRPARFRLSRRLARIIMQAGFILFLTGISVQFNSLIERSYVSGELGLEALGRLYLAFMFLALFQMVPTLVQQVFLPVIVNHFKARDHALVSREMRNLVGIMLAYCGITAAALWLIAAPLLDLVLPQYSEDLRWVYLLAPGLMAFAIAAPFALMFNVVIDYRWHAAAYAGGSAATVLALGAALMAGRSFSLDGVIILRGAIYALMAGVLLAGWWQLSATHRAFRLVGA